MLDEETKRRIGSVESWICPECGSALEKVPAKEMHPAHAKGDWARKCSNPECPYLFYVGD
jgi:hypothetical protein